MNNNKLKLAIKWLVAICLFYFIFYWKQFYDDNIWWHLPTIILLSFILIFVTAFAIVGFMDLSHSGINTRSN